MDCNRVFFALTSRPFPTGSPEDSFVECHLLECASCRQIAEALRPCEAPNHESLTPAERRGLPRYHPEPPFQSQLSPVTAVPSAMEARLHATPSKPGPQRQGTVGQPRPAARHQIEGGRITQQLAAFSLAPRRRRNRFAEAASLAAVGLLVALGGWGLGWLTM